MLAKTCIMQHIYTETHDFDLTHNHFTKMAQLDNTSGTTAMLWPVLPHCGSTARITAVVPQPGKIQNSPITSPLEIPYRTHAVVPPCGTTGNHSAVLPLLEKSKSPKHLLWKLRTAHPAVLPSRGTTAEHKPVLPF